MYTSLGKASYTLPFPSQLEYWLYGCRVGESLYTILEKYSYTLIGLLFVFCSLDIGLAVSLALIFNVVLQIELLLISALFEH